MIIHIYTLTRNQFEYSTRWKAKRGQNPTLVEPRRRATYAELTREGFEFLGRLPSCLTWISATRRMSWTLRRTSRRRSASGNLRRCCETDQRAPASSTMLTQTWSGRRRSWQRRTSRYSTNSGSPWIMIDRIDRSQWISSSDIMMCQLIRLAAVLSFARFGMLCCLPLI